MRHTLSSLLLFAVVGFAAPHAAADGVVFQTTAASTESLATAQRALLWQRSGVWEVHIQPQFDRAAGAAAWVVPFPVRPTIEEGSAELLDQLERLTAPLFVEQCRVPCCSDFCDGGTTTENRDSETDVTIWETGTVGGLDYAILSAGSGDSLVTWLDTEDYALPSGAADLLAALETEGLFFFASRLAAGIDPALPIAPVRFVLPDLADPHYPLRLTALGVPAGETLELTLWVVFPPDAEGRGFMPSSHPYAALSAGELADADGFRAALDEFFAGHDPGTFAYLFGQQLPGRPVRTIRDAYGGFSEYVDPEPPDWTDEVEEMAAENAMLQRYHGRLTAAALAVDFELEQRAEFDVLQEDNAFVTFAGDCFSCSADDADVGTDVPADTRIDAGLDAGTDGFPLEPEDDGGCTCAVPSAATRGDLLALLLPAVWLLRRRRPESRP